MDLRKLTSHQIKEINKLIERKESLESELQKIDQQLAGYETGHPMPARKKGKGGRPPKRSSASSSEAAPRSAFKPRKRAPRGQLKEGIINALSNAGKEGLKVKELAERLNTSTGNIHAWFFTTGKKMKGIKKVGPGQYALSGKYQ